MDSDTIATLKANLLLNVKRKVGEKICESIARIAAGVNSASGVLDTNDDDRDLTKCKVFLFSLSLLSYA